MDSPSPFLSEVNALGGIEKLLKVIACLRHPEKGCPWDLKQTHHSLKPHLLEESYELLEAIDTQDIHHIKEELGDVLLQVVLHAQLAQDAGQFDFQMVCDAISEKLVRRHPHVFGDTVVGSAEEVTQNWQAIKKAEKQGVFQNSAQNSVVPEASPSILEGVNRQMPALLRALEVSKRAVGVGFEWPDEASLWACVMSEFDEFQQEALNFKQLKAKIDGETALDKDSVEGSENKKAQQHLAFQRLEAEMGDIFFATVNLARHYKINPEVALTGGIAKFTKRFQTMESLAQGTPLTDLTFEAWDDLWKQAKVLTEKTPSFL
ncbi:MAG: nucleoside triphosphate pyrophosphohydrolase [Cyanobacteria bacterium]|nr:nucleoside triphosphate pyrophosphohydrolase [Cyanobacteriota bacterium]